jgi:acetyltransferase-like isoleucine patch superfamily enzyme
MTSDRPRNAIGAASRMAVRLDARRFGSNALEITADRAFVTARLDIRGRRNRLIVEPGARLIGVRITMWGDDNTIRIGADARLFRSHLWAEGQQCRVTVGDRSTLERGTKLAAVEPGSSLTIGSDCICAERAELRTSDSHAIFDVDDNRINPAADISIGHHVWIGNGALVLKGVSLASHSIVAARAVIARSNTEEGTVLAGIPARVVRKDVSWKRA